MQQQEIQFFWPLTEQIPLGLDYTGCEKPKLEYTNSLSTDGTGITFTTGPATTWVAMEINPSKLTVNVDEVCFKQKEKPNILRRIIYKIIGIKWELR
jgi:hypothetical protein